MEPRSGFPPGRKTTTENDDGNGPAQSTPLANAPRKNTPFGDTPHSDYNFLFSEPSWGWVVAGAHFLGSDSLVGNHCDLCYHSYYSVRFSEPSWCCGCPVLQFRSPSRGPLRSFFTFLITTSTFPSSVGVGQLRVSGSENLVGNHGVLCYLSDCHVHISEPSWGWAVAGVQFLGSENLVGNHCVRFVGNVCGCPLPVFR